LRPATGRRGRLRLRCAAARHVAAGDREADVELAARAELAVEGEPAAVLLDDDRARDREALAGAATDLLGRVERVEDVRADRVGDRGPGVADRDDDLIALGPGPDRDPAARAGSAHRVADRVRGVDD